MFLDSIVKEYINIDLNFTNVLIEQFRYVELPFGKETINLNHQITSNFHERVDVFHEVSHGYLDL